MTLGRNGLPRRSRSSIGEPAPRGSFYVKLESALESEGFDHAIEELARPYYSNRRGRRSLPPGVYFRMLLVGQLEGIVSQRELAWRCADSLSLRQFLGYGPRDATPDHSTITLVRRRLPVALHEQAFRLMLAAARTHDVLRGRRLALAFPWPRPPATLV